MIKYQLIDVTNNYEYWATDHNAYVKVDCDATMLMQVGLFEI